ncbi:hypothetical protein IFO69_02930 [Echinicola sp. CAU 1574]|uniref:Uncharacterized protein n=1 Tax=Echinicola arenosa TaxID=2774144 RepID=A0ABR9AFR4_9BACT|nr:hypothetical protein [Echinicola arenosa]MBD8487695.1 hypothetical protein [Echinicola arenosa]
MNIKLDKTISEVRGILSSNFERTRKDPYYKLPEEYRHLTSEFAFHLTKDKLRIHFSKELKRQINHSFQINYPRFIGQLTETDGKTQLKGVIGFRDWVFIFPVLWLTFFIALYISWVRNPTEMKDGEFAIYFIAIGGISFLVGLIRSRTKVFEIRAKINELFELDAN